MYGPPPNGEYELFDSRKGFERLMTEFTNHIHGRYALSFEPEDPSPGLHHLRVRLAAGGGKRSGAHDGAHSVCFSTVVSSIEPRQEWQRRRHPRSDFRDLV